MRISGVFKQTDFVSLAILKFYSRIVIKKLGRDQLHLFRKVERISKIITKCSADLKFLKSKKLVTIKGSTPSPTHYRLNFQNIDIML